MRPQTFQQFVLLGPGYGELFAVGKDHDAAITADVARNGRQGDQVRCMDADEPLYGQVGFDVLQRPGDHEAVTTVQVQFGVVAEGHRTEDRVHPQHLDAP